MAALLEIVLGLVLVVAGALFLLGLLVQFTPTAGSGTRREPPDAARTEGGVGGAGLSPAPTRSGRCSRYAATWKPSVDSVC